MAISCKGLLQHLFMEDVGGEKGHGIGLDSGGNYHPFAVPGLPLTLSLWENVGNSSTQAAPTEGENRQSPPSPQGQKGLVLRGSHLGSA